jgi:uncharacterized protein (TIGR02466 family)
MSDLEMKIDRHDLWCDTMFNVSVPQVDNQAILDFYHDLRSKNQGIVRSNRGGWQCDVGFNMCQALDDMFHKVEYAATHIFRDVLGIQENLVLANAWLNSNQYGNSNSLHTHPGALFSGVYYVNGNGDDDNGTIGFCREGAHSVEQTLTTTERTREYHERDRSWRVAHSVPAAESHALLFAPWIVHEVTTNLTDFDRLVVGLNFTNDHEQR